MRLAITGHSQHYLMFGWWLPACWLLFPHYCEHRKCHVSITTLLTYMSDCVKYSKKHKHVLTWGWKAEVVLLIAKPMPFHWNQVTWSWQKPTPAREEKGERPVGEGNMWSGMPDWWRHPFIPYEEPVDRMPASPPELTFSLNPNNGSSFKYRCMCWVERCTTTILNEPTPKVSENEKVPQSAKCLPLAQHQSSETPLGWDNRNFKNSWKYFLEPPCQTKGEKLNVEERGYVAININALDVDVLITLMKLERSDQFWFP